MFEDMLAQYFKKCLYNALGHDFTMFEEMFS